MYLKKVELAAKKGRDWRPGTGGYDFIAAFLKLKLVCPVCQKEGEFEVDQFNINEDVRGLKSNSQFVAVMKEFCCENCGVSSQMPGKDQKRALAALTDRAIERLKKNLPRHLRALQSSA